MSPVFRFRSGALPLLISVPHDGRNLPPDIKARMTAVGQSIPDTDWDVEKLYEFAAEMGANVIVANYSRYVVDLNRSADDAQLYPGQIATGLCPEHTFSGETIYRSAGIDESEKVQRIEKYWRPYHTQLRDTLDALKAKFGFALLWDAHSIPSIVPRLFDGALPELNLGSNSGASCGQSIQDAVAGVAAESGYDAVINGRFKGGYITRHYGDPEKGLHALQLEIAQRAYMTERTNSFDATRAVILRDTLRKMLHSFVNAARHS